MYLLLRRCLCVLLFPAVQAPGLLLLYRPKDISNACVFSEHLRYDLSFGMGMSDTITLVLRTLAEVDYGCTMEIAAESSVQLLVVIRYPNLVISNCAMNQDAFSLLKKWRCLRLCDIISDRDLQTHYFTFHVKERLRLKFLSNSSINAELNAHFYQVTVTSARYQPAAGCLLKNETVCTIGEDHFCFTSGVVCDGIKNCGVDNWFDERKSQCSLPVERLGSGPVVALLAAALCALLALAHLIQRCLPPLADSFFIFNANEDNRLCIDPVLVPGDHIPPEIPALARTSIIPIYTSSSEESNKSLASTHGHIINVEITPLGSTLEENPHREVAPDPPETRQRKSNLKSIAERIQETLRSFTLSRRTESITNTN